MSTLLPSQIDRAHTAAHNALRFSDSQNAELPTAVIRYLWFDGAVHHVIDALGKYQNADGGFGNRLEPDIHAPASNPFAARIAMQYLSLIPQQHSQEMRARLSDWLVTNQNIDGDWHFSEETKSGFLQPWFAAWTFPSLNPACCVAGLAASLGLATPAMLARTAALYEERSSLDDVADADFYGLLPYVEYTRGVAVPDEMLDAIAGNIVRTVEAKGYEDAEHFFTHALGGSPSLGRRIPSGMVVDHAEMLLDAQQPDGGWPTPYDEAWRVWTTANAMITLALLR